MSELKPDEQPSRDKPTRQTRRRILVLPILAATTIAGIASDTLRDTISNISGSISNKATEYLWSMWADALPDPASGDRLAIIVAELQGDSDGAQTKHVIRSLTTAFAADEASAPVQLITIPRHGLGLRSRGDAAENREAAQLKATELLRIMNGDVLVWGEVIQEGDVLELRVTPKMTFEGETPGGRLTLTKTIELPAGFSQELGGALAGIAVSQVKSAYDNLPVVQDDPADSWPDRVESQYAQLAPYVQQRLLPLVYRLKPLAESPPPALSGASLTAVRDAYSELAASIADSAPSASAIDFVISAKRLALRDRPRDEEPSSRARAEISLATTLMFFAVISMTNVSALDEAALLLRKAEGDLRTSTGDYRKEIRWSQTHLAQCLLFSGRARDNKEQLIEALAIYRKLAESSDPDVDSKEVGEAQLMVAQLTKEIGS